MHEISLIQNLVENVLGEITAKGYSGEKIKGLALSLGALELHSEEAFRQAFDIESKGTVLEGARLELTIVPATLSCPACGFHGPLPDDEADPHHPELLAECPECGAPAPLEGGRGVAQIELILE